MKTTTSWARILILPILLAAAACDDDPTSPGEPPPEALEPGHALLDGEAMVSLTVEADAFQPGAEATLILENGGGETVGFNLCFHELERRIEESWETVEPEEGRVCTMELNMLDPGGEARFDLTLPPYLEAGEYRFRVALQLMDQEKSRDQVSGPFQIEG